MSTPPEQIELSSTSFSPLQQLVDRLIDSISDSDQDINKVKALLNGLDAREIDKIHSTSRLSPLETVLSRYPLISDIDVQILHLLFKKGANVGKVKDGILEGMIKVEHLEENQAREEFAAVLMEKLEALDQVEGTEQNKEIREAEVKAAQSDGLSSPLTPLSSSPASTTSSPSIPIRQLVTLSTSFHPQSRNVSTDSPPQTLKSALPIVDSEPLPSHDHLTPSISLTRPSTPPIPTRQPSSLIRLSVPLCYSPSLTHNRVLYYFTNILGVQISDLEVDYKQRPRAYFSVERNLWDSGELIRKSKAAEVKGQLIHHRWYLRFEVAIDDPSWNLVNGRGDKIQEDQEGELNSGTFQSRDQRSTSSFLPKKEYSIGSNWTKSINGGDQEGEWIRLSFQGFPDDLTTREIETLLSRFLPHSHYRDLFIQNGAFVSSRGNDVIVRLSVKGEELARIAEREGRKLMFVGKRIRVSRVVKAEKSCSIVNGGRDQSGNGTSSRDRLRNVDRWTSGDQRIDTKRQGTLYEDQERYSTSSIRRRRRRSASSEREDSDRRRSRSPSSRRRNSYDREENDGSRFAISRGSEAQDEEGSSKRRGRRERRR